VIDLALADFVYRGFQLGQAQPDAIALENGSTIHSYRKRLRELPTR
jgi:hypothetical protein